MTIRTFEINLSVEEVFFFEDGRTIFVGTLDRTIDDKIDLRKIFPCNATLVLNRKDNENFSLYMEYFTHNRDRPEIKAFGTFNQLKTQKDVIRQSIANHECMIRMSISPEDE